MCQCLQFAHFYQADRLTSSTTQQGPVFRIWFVWSVNVSALVLLRLRIKFGGVCEIGDETSQPATCLRTYVPTSAGGKYVIYYTELLHEQTADVGNTVMEVAFWRRKIWKIFVFDR